MKIPAAIFASLVTFQLVIANSVVSFHKRDTLATQEDLENTISFFETTSRSVVASGNSSEPPAIVFQSVYDIISGKTPITGVTINDPGSVKNIVLPRIWGPWCKIVRCFPIHGPFPHPTCDPTRCDPIPDIFGCIDGFCGPKGPKGPVFPVNPVVDPIDPDFALEILPDPQLESKDLEQLISGLGNLATSWRYSFEKSSASLKVPAVRAPPADGNLEKRLSTTQLKLVVIILIITLIVTTMYCSLFPFFIGICTEIWHPLDG